MSERICATPGCDRPARWISITEGNTLGSAAPRRCVQCCDAIGEAITTYLRSRVCCHCGRPVATEQASRME